MTGEGLPILVDLVDQGVIRILDLVFVAKGQDGSLGIIALADLDHDGTIDLAVFEGVSSGLVSQEDLADAAPAIAPGSSAAILIFENRWATSFVQALRRGDAARRRRLHPPNRPHRRSRRGGGLKGDRHATAPRYRTYRCHRRHGHRRVEPCLTSPGKPLGATRRPAVRTDSSRPRHRPQAAAPARDQVAQLKDLADLQSQGILSDAEFEAHKAKILAGP